MTDTEILDALRRAAAGVRAGLDSLEDWGLAPDRAHAWQYRCDTVADPIAVAVLSEAGLGVLSEESGLHHADRDVVVVLDPVDGSTNAAHGIPFFCVSMCALDVDGPRAAVVADLVSGSRYEAVRGGGATFDGAAIAPSACTAMADAVVATQGHPQRHLGWRQYRVLGSAALEMCLVASGALDAFISIGRRSLSPWDYLGALLVCRESGAVVDDVYGEELVLRTIGQQRSPVAAATPELLADALAARRALD